MRYINEEEITQSIPCVVALGNFDGLHIGHKRLIEEVKRQASLYRVQGAVFSFFPHPAFVLANRKNFQLIYTKEEKIKKIEELGIELYIEYPFTQSFAQIPPEQFIQKILYNQLHSKVVIVGKNFKFGKERKGDIHLLHSLGEKLGFQTLAISPVQIQGEEVSSTRIRQHLAKGEINKANILLGEPYSIMGTVVKGKQLGRTIGFPTVNLIPSSDKLLPDHGVYITYVQWLGQKRPSITSVGSNPTVYGKKTVVESYLLDFEQDLYGESIKVEFLEWLRPEHRFHSLTALMYQIQEDEKRARAYFERFK